MCIRWRYICSTGHLRPCGVAETWQRKQIDPTSIPRTSYGLFRSSTRVDRHYRCFNPNWSQSRWLLNCQISHFAVSVWRFNYQSWQLMITIRGISSPPGEWPRGSRGNTTILHRSLGRPTDYSGPTGGPALPLFQPQSISVTTDAQLPTSLPCREIYSHGGEETDRRNGNALPSNARASYGLFRPKMVRHYRCFNPNRSQSRQPLKCPQFPTG